MRPAGDGELVRLVRSGNKEAFGELIERYQPMVRRLAFGMMAQEDWVQEVIQEAFLAAYLSLDQLREPERFKAKKAISYASPIPSNRYRARRHHSRW